MTDIAAASQPWYRSLSRTQWKTLIAANLGWVFDGYETYALIISVGVALRQLLDPASYSQIPLYAGTVIALTLLGWAIGGMIGGVVADYIGRKRAMILAILAYSILTGLSAFAWDWLSFAVLRFFVGLAIGSEWVTGTSIVSELWPDKNRGKGVGLMQCGFGIGFFLASLAWLFISPLGPDAWRVMFLLGVAPALLTLWIRRAIPESDKWERVNERRAAATERKRSGAALSGQEESLARFTMLDLFAERDIRTRVILTFLMSLASTFAFWGISAWMPPYTASVAAKAGLPAQQWVSYVAMASNGAAIIGYAGFGFLADVFGRRPVTMAYFALAFLSVPVFFIWTQDLTLLLLAGAFSGNLCIRPVHLDVGVAAGAVPNARARDRHRVRFQRAAPDFMDGPADLGLADREFRRLQPGGGRDRDGLYPRPRGGFPAGDARKAAAGVERVRIVRSGGASSSRSLCPLLRQKRPKCCEAYA
jgi:MFS family permease